ncbi:hypothetical protein [uncultured Oscillibacter sp.]|uniref:hypothetical protein n=1 Tax=uncultured Oscillibacter sp. TaxID=876091 RepID=UPI0025E2CFF5|nr:hypothetical protein [uncultured Oscillibacter sp.]
MKWIFGLVGAGLIFVVRLLWRRQRATELGIQALLRDRILKAYYHYQERGTITLHGLENVDKLYEQYHNLGGNGTVTKLVHDLREMEVVDG